MNLQKRQARAKRRAKTLRLIRQFPRLPAPSSKFSRGSASGLGMSTWRGNVRKWQSHRKTARRRLVSAVFV
jgi:hypothetical protein